MRKILIPPLDNIEYLPIYQFKHEELLGDFGEETNHESVYWLGVIIIMAMIQCYQLYISDFH